MRSGVLLIEDDRVALIRRVNNRGTYYLFPGGGVEPGETPEQAAVREAREELGLDVEIEGLLAVVHYGNDPQYFYLARRAGGVFGSGTGSELASPAGSARGSYTPVWVERGRLAAHNVRPPELAALIASNAVRLSSAPLQIDEVPAPRSAGGGPG